MDQIDKNLLNIIQTDFPIDPRPYDVLGARLAIEPGEALRRVRNLVESGVIRKIGPSFNTGRLGHVSALVAARIPKDNLDQVAETVSSFAQVTHNYSREFDYNLWFTLVCENQRELDSTIDSIRSAADIEDVRVLPAERTFKIRVDFEF
jgi:DNA-binding Lrp family transcriptional regulator